MGKTLVNTLKAIGLAALIDVIGCMPPGERYAAPYMVQPGYDSWNLGAGFWNTGNSMGRNNQNPGNNNMRNTSQEEPLPELFTCNYYENFDKDEFVTLNEYVGRKNRFSKNENITWVHKAKKLGNYGYKILDSNKNMIITRKDEKARGPPNNVRWYGPVPVKDYFSPGTYVLIIFEQKDEDKAVAVHQFEVTE